MKETQTKIKVDQYSCQKYYIFFELNPIIFFLNVQTLEPSRSLFEIEAG